MEEDPPGGTPSMEEDPPGGAPSALKEELRCPICFDPFREAVTLRCGHNFCRGCVRRSWEQQRPRSCPVCKEASGRDEPRVNHTLSNLVEMLLRDPAGAEGAAGAAALCPLHGEEVKFFCLQDKELTCCSCHGARGEHGGHRGRPVPEAAADCRAKLVNMEAALKDKAKDFGIVRRSYKHISKHNRSASERVECQVKRELRKLHEFLWDEEKVLLAQLQEELQRKQELIQGKLERLERDNQALLDETRMLQQELLMDDLTFLRSHKSRKRRIACTAEEPEDIPWGLLLDVPRYLGSLQFNVCKKMLGSISAVPFTFDPGTAASWLRVSEDLCRVWHRGFQLSVENPERFVSAPCVLGSRGFSGGRHAWEVDVAGASHWRVGVARPRRDSRWSFHHDSRGGFWFVYRLPGKAECRASHSARSEAPAVTDTAASGLRRIRVELDCDEGELSFYNAERGAHIYTFHGRFGGTVFPYFYLGEPRNQPLRICPSG
ncbi:E3 ubiquitin-protein ligase TRIM35 [Myiozetetes cayanensis]|uniref:E3 ubiquitin-protein ligase TRIM35 n=1 Tax=Myiozetetes cayanensis TaxID=478635 RepID=UPI00216056A9|nr:E3 ubiquitin-protein ligase TRIM35 [Myiozetetes cayanensis]